LLAIQSRSAQTQMQAYALQAQELGRLMVEAAQSVQPRSWSRRPLDAFNVPVIDQLLVWLLTRAADVWPFNVRPWQIPATHGAGLAIPIYV
jgi:hypothetical protein